MFKLIDENVSQFVDFTEDELTIFNSFLVLRKVPRRFFIIRPGDICNVEIFLVSGCIRKYYISPNGTETTLSLDVENSWISDYESYDNLAPSRLYFETLEQSVFLELSMQSKEKLLKEIPKFERIFRLMLRNQIALMQERLISTLSTSAKEKYLNFIEQFPNLANRVPQHYIASYLGVSAEFLSKVRKKLSMQNRNS